MFIWLIVIGQLTIVNTHSIRPIRRHQSMRERPALELSFIVTDVGVSPRSVSSSCVLTGDDGIETDIAVRVVLNNSFAH
jgi:hypothetical protein